MTTKQLIRAVVFGLGIGSLGTTMFYVAVHARKWGAVAFMLLVVAAFIVVTTRTYRRSPEK